MSDDDDDVEWEYEDESDAHDEADDEVAASPHDDQGANDADIARRSPAEADDDGDVDWEDASEPQFEPTLSQDPPLDDDEYEDDADTQHAADTAVVEDLNAVNWDHINSVLQRQAEKEAASDGQKPKRKVVRMTKQDKEHELALHKSHLLLLLARQRRINALCQSRVLRGLLLSLTSDSSIDFFRKLDEMQLKYALETLVRWFNQHFQVADGGRVAEDAVRVKGEESDGALTETGLLRVVYDRRGRHAELVLLFASLCRSLGLRTRLTLALDAVAVQQRTKAADKATTSASPSAGVGRKRRRRVHEDDVDAATEPKIASMPSDALMQWVWCEIWDAKSKNWVMVDPIRKIVGRPQDIHNLRGPMSPLSYVVSVEDDGFLADVTPRYAERWSKTMPHRLAHEWLLRSLQLLNAVVHESISDSADHQRREAERAKLLQMTESEEMPTSFEAFRKHHLYCLERHLTQAECIHPKKAVGLFKGHAVYLRKNIQTTRTWYQWRRLGREVRDSERDRPVKRQGGAKKAVKSGSASGSDDDGDDNGDANSGDQGKALYGYWQTDEVLVPCVDGVTVPKNKFGNIELWSPAHLPEGAVHLVLPRIEKVAQQLGVDFAPALVGFEARDGRNVPKFEGIVVAAVVADTLLDAHAHFQHSMIEKAIDKNQQIIVRRWEKLVKRVLLKLRLNEEYGEV